ncbi:hypothetical protein [Foetidibacter luteolus]|uniref:hypothetical protein n=1 Tax=Foetidibacter luteolus TaxID=2608880 RepID=UPI00129B0A14|nr:hypothetical protein [Foetidibacter luteolus]
MMTRIVLSSLFVFFACAGYSQHTNIDPNQSYINVNTPRSPESAGFEKYGATQVNEFTGATNIAIPIYTLKSRFLELPITLSYQATGIRVNQEASWVGLGWDLNAGGRITVETRGCADFNGTTRGLTSPANLATGMQRIFTRVGSNGENAVLTPSTLCESGQPECSTNTSFDHLAAVQEMTQYGTGEPDIFRANFMGHSLTYYVDKVSNTIKFIGEKSLAQIVYTLDANNNITGWTITDNSGVKYYFNQAETSTNTLSGNPVVPATTTTAWLLTKAEHPTGDYIQFTYNNYGYIVPAFTMSSSVNWLATGGPANVANDYTQNVVLQSTYYLTRVESADAVVDFLLSTRTDLYGPGARKISQIKVSDKITSAVKKTTTFNYSYFQTSFKPWSTYLAGLFYNLPSPLTTSGYLACSNSRLRLDSVSANLDTYQPPYRFNYNTVVPDKYSYGQDHWGYYNDVSNHTNGYSFSHLIPYSGLGGVGNAIPSSSLNINQIGFNRECSATSVQAMILTGVVYPTGGRTTFEYEPHQSTMVPTVPVTGGGVRVKTVSNYESGNLTGTTTYSYSIGKYMGSIQYYTTANELTACGAGSNGQMKYSSNGAVNFNDILIGYDQITIAQQGSSGESNGYVVKKFDINTPSSNYSNLVGFDIAPPYYPPGEPPPVNGNQTYEFWLDAAHKNLAPTPSANLEGKLIEELYYDNSDNLIKSIKNYYKIADYSNSFYDIRAIQNRSGGFDYSGCTPNGGFGSGGNRPVILFVSPAKSFYTLKDSVVERTYSGTSSVKKKITYKYNDFYQPMFEAVHNSDGTQTISYTRTSAEIVPPGPGNPSGIFATQMYQMRDQHILELPIEQTIVNRSTTGDSTVVSSRFNVYQNALPMNVYIMESAQQPTFRTQFIPWKFSSSAPYSVNIDSRYKPYSTADYSTSNLIRTLHTLQGDKAYIWDESYNTLMAQCINTNSDTAAFTSFETQAKGGWAYNAAGGVADNTSPTGVNAYNLASGNISFGTLSNTGAYTVSYWTKGTTSYSVTGSTSVKKGRTVNGWTYYEHKVSGVTSVTISGSGRIDEVRLHPASAQMISYTYEPLVGLKSQCETDGRILYYVYDAIGRLAWVKDMDGNIVKTIQYHYKGLAGIQY